MRWRVPFTTLVLSAALAAHLNAQLVDQPHRAEALRYFRIGQELLSSEQFEKAIAAFSRAVRSGLRTRSTSKLSRVSAAATSRASSRV